MYDFLYNINPKNDIFVAQEESAIRKLPEKEIYCSLCIYFLQLYLD